MDLFTSIHKKCADNKISLNNLNIFDTTEAKVFCSNCYQIKN